MALCVFSWWRMGIDLVGGPSCIDFSDSGTACNLPHADGMSRRASEVRAARQLLKAIFCQRERILEELSDTKIDFDM